MATDSPSERTIISFTPPYRLKDLLGLDSPDVKPINDLLFKIRAASSEGSLSEASNLLKEKYEWRGYRSGALSAHPHYVTLLAYANDGLIGTMTLGIDSDSGLSVDQTYKAEVDALRSQGRRVAEITKLAAENGSSSKRVLASLIHITYIYARYVHQRTDFLIEINPRHLGYYERRLGFRQYGPERMCDRANAPACLMHIDLDYVDQQVELFGGTGGFSRNREKSLYPYFFSKHDEQGVAARLMQQQSGRTEAS